MSGEDSTAGRLARVRERIAAAAERAGRRSEEVLLVGASKTVDAERIQAAIAAGLTDFGENYVQEAAAKQAALQGQASAGERGAPAVRWHLIGHLQRNKVRDAVALFDIIQSLDSDRLAGALGRHGEARAKRLAVLLEVDFTALPDRSGLSPGAVAAAVEAVLEQPCLELQGLMTVPAPGLDASATRSCYRRLAGLRDELATRYPGDYWRHLSMGMTDDFELAIEEGATIVRIGRAIFGERH